MQGSLPVAGLKVPVGHAIHAPSSKVYPWEHSDEQPDSDVLPAADCILSDGHVLQVKDETAAMSGEYLPEPQFEHVFAVLLPLPLEYVPAGQF